MHIPTQPVPKKRRNLLKKTRKLALILVMALVILPLTGCLDELAHMEEDFLALEERAPR